jgi:hypothetical protein
MTHETKTPGDPFAAKELPGGGYEYYCFVQEISDGQFTARFDAEDGGLNEIRLDFEDLSPEDIERLEPGVSFSLKVVPKELPDPCAVMDRIDGNITAIEVELSIELHNHEPLTQADIEEALARVRSRRAARLQIGLALSNEPKSPQEASDASNL